MEQNFQKILVENIESFLQPLLGAAESPTVRKRLFREMGWNFDEDSGIPEVALVNQITNLVTPIQQLTNLIENPPESLADLIDVLETLKSLFNQLKGIKTSIEGIGSVITPEMLADFGEDLLQYLVTRYIRRESKTLYDILRVLVIIDTKKSDQHLVAPSGKVIRYPYAFPYINFDHIGDFLEDPLAHLKSHYFSFEDITDAVKAQEMTDKLFPLLAELIQSMGGNAVYGFKPSYQIDFGSAGNQMMQKSLNFEFETPIDNLLFGATVAYSSPDEGDLGWVIMPYGEFTFEQAIGKYQLTASTSASIGALSIGKDGIEFILDDHTNASLKLSFLKLPEDESGAAYLIGSSTGTRMEIGMAEIGTELAFKSEKLSFDIFLKLIDSKFVIDAGEQDGFLAKVLPEDGLVIDFDFLIGYHNEKGIYLGGGAALEFTLPLHLDILGVVKVDNIHLLLGVNEDGLLIVVDLTVGVTLGPFNAVVEQMGLKLPLEWKGEEKNLGILNAKPGLKPPAGIGLSLDAGAVKGGGYIFFDPDNERYAGALELSINNQFSVVAIGLITTRMPDGSKGFSLLLSISVQFTPGFVLGYGFFLSGLGGLIGINRTVNTEALREGVKRNAIDHILFPEDVIENITQIITDMRSFFPPQKNQFMIGLMAKITWSVPPLVSIEFGLIIEFTSPVRLAILGVLKAMIPTEEAAILQLQVNFVGIIDFEKGFISFDASLTGSRLLTFTLDGDMALRMSWGEQKGFLVSVGGFHPSYQPPAFLQVGVMKRLTISILSGNPNLVLTTYFAVTSNTVQFGAAIDFYFKVSKFKVLGYFGFDVLFQFSPFFFIASIRAGVEIVLGSTTLFSIRLEFELQGPTPWKAKGTASFKVLFLTVKVRFNKTWGEKKEVQLPTVPILPKLLEEFEKPVNWESQLPANRHLLVSMKEFKLEEGELLLHPAGSLVISQSVLPLEIDIKRFGNNYPQDILKAKILAVEIEDEVMETGVVTDDFAPAAFKEMSDDDKLKAPSFVPEKSGIKVKSTDEIRTNYAINRKVEYEVRASDYDPHAEEPYVLHEFQRLGRFSDELTSFRKMAGAGAIFHSDLSKANKSRRQKQQGLAVDTSSESFVVANISDLSRSDTISISGSKAEVDDALQSLLRQQPKLKGKLQIVSEYELQD